MLQKFIPNRFDIQSATMTGKDPKFFFFFFLNSLWEKEKKKPEQLQDMMISEGNDNHNSKKSNPISQDGHRLMSTNSKCRREPGDG